jgi:serine/threonine protein phosphatase PrpC
LARGKLARGTWENDVTDRLGGPDGAADAEPRIEVGLATDVGRVRSGNEDSILCEPLESVLVAERGLFCAVADGMGGHAAGEEASSMAVKIARDSFYGGSGEANPIETLRLAVAQANLAIYEAGAGKTGRDHMGTTLTAAVLFSHRVVVGHVGDSRCYLVQGNEIRQISRDHSWVAEEVEAGRMTPEQARVNPRRNIITRALGLRPDVDVDAYEAPLQPGSTVVICSDGLHGLVGEDEIISYVRRLPPADAVDALVHLANDRGGPDNISVVVARVMGDGADEADTERGFPVLSGEMMATARADFSDLQAPSVYAQPADEPTEAAPEPVPAVPPPVAPIAPAAEIDHEPPAARTPVTTSALAHTPEPQPKGGRGGGVALLVVLLLLLILGSAIGYLLFRWAGIAG